MERIFDTINGAKEYQVSVGAGSSCSIRGVYNRLDLKTIAGKKALCFTKGDELHLGSALPDDLCLLFLDGQTLINIVTAKNETRIDMGISNIKYTIYCVF